jgi:hypothetical protein
VRKELEALAAREDLFTLYDVFESNIYGGGYTPFTSWGVAEQTLSAVVQKRVRLLGAFDLAGFIYLARSLGMDLKLSTTKEAAKFFGEVGGAELVVCGHRVLVHEVKGARAVIGRGLISRFVHDLYNPILILRKQADFDPERDLT